MRSRSRCTPTGTLTGTMIALSPTVSRRVGWSESTDGADVVSTARSVYGASPMNAVELEFRHVGHRYGNVVAVADLSFHVPAGKICVLVGPSGCGKTTSLKMVNRLIEPTSGQILVGGQDIMSQDPIELRRGIGYVIQQVGLMPHLTVGDNVAIVPRLLGWDAKRIDVRVKELLALVGLEPDDYRKRYPAQLSGGERQ